MNNDINIEVNKDAIQPVNTGSNSGGSFWKNLGGNINAGLDIIDRATGTVGNVLNTVRGADKDLNAHVYQGPYENSGVGGGLDTSKLVIGGVAVATLVMLVNVLKSNPKSAKK